MQQSFAHETSGDVRGFQVMAKPVGPLCNLRCRYCFYLEKENLFQEEKHWRIAPDVLESFIRQQIQAQNTSGVSFAWQGGEPTLTGVEYFKKVVEIEQKYADGKEINNAFQTNGTLLDDRWCAFLAENKFLVGLSIDGPRELHDQYRVNKGGTGGSFDQVMRGIDLLKKYKVDFNTLTAVHRSNSKHPLDVYRFLKEVGSGFIQFIPIVERFSSDANENNLQLAPPGFVGSARVTEWSVEPEEYGEFLCSIYDEWVRHDVARIFVQLFDVALESWLGIQPNLCTLRETCGDCPVLERNGDLFSCDHYVFPEYRLGNIKEQPLEGLARSAQQIGFGRNKLHGLPQYCRECRVRFACNGECPKHRFMKTPDGGAGLNYLCAAYKRFFQHIDPAMQFMAEELRNRRPPANVMKWMLEQDRIPRRRNDPCFCGSGKKYKQCHGT